MKLGLFTPVFGKLTTSEMLAKVKGLGMVQAIELGTGGWPGRDHIDVDKLLEARVAGAYRTMITDPVSRSARCPATATRCIRTKTPTSTTTFQEDGSSGRELEVPVSSRSPVSR